MSLHRAVLRSLLFSGFFFCQWYALAVFAQVHPRLVEAVDNTRRISLSGNVYPLARAEFDRGAVAESQPMNRMLLLLKRGDDQEAALQDYLAQQQNKSSANYHTWLTPEQFGTQFGPADADIQAVTGWLTQQGFTIGKVYSGKTVIEFSGTAAQVQQAFGTAIHNYEVDGKLYSANANDPQIPAALAPVVAGVVSLHNFPRQFYAHRFGLLRRAEGKSTLEPLVTLPNPFGSGPFYGIGPGDFAKIYGTPANCGTPAAPCTGSGQTIAIVGETNLLVGDVQQFRSVFGLPATFDATNIVYNGEDPGITSTDEEGEADLDNQWSGAVAPGATIKYVLSASTSASTGVDLSALYIIEHNLAGVMSESYGECEFGLGSTANTFFNTLWEQASAQGITVAISAGDSGSAGCDDPHTESMAAHGPAVSGLASTPYNIAVGGTDFDEYGNWTKYWSSTNDSSTGTSALGYVPEIPWNQSCAQLGTAGCNVNTPTPLQNIIAGGGGPSGTYSKPVWQVGTAGMPNDGKRDVPDISLFASPGFNGSGYLYCQGDLSSPCIDSQAFTGYMTFGVIGGTSVSAPAFAGVMALVNQSQATAQNRAPRQGNTNYVFYALANKSGASCASMVAEAAGCVFNDIVKGSTALPTGGTGIGTISVPCKGGVPDCNAGVAGQIGVLVTASGSTQEAWASGAGYDLATGLGSLNISNLIADWGSVSSVPTSTALTLLPMTGITHGSESVTATINVTPKSATGTVSLLAKLPDGTTFGVGAFNLGANGTVSGTTTNLPGGNNYQVYAHYSGDGTNAPSDSTPVMVTVAQESSKTFIVVPTFNSTTGAEISGNASSVTYGSLYIVRVYVTNNAGVANPTGAPGGACAQTNKVACPSGTVSLTANGNAVDGATFNLNDIGYTRDISPTLPGGTYPLAAAYNGDSSYQPSNGSETFTVNPAPTILGPPLADGNMALIGQTASIEAILTTQAFTGIAPGGTVTFYDGNTALPGSVTLTPTAPTGSTPGGLFALSLTAFTNTGLHTITAKYSGDANYAAATSSGSAALDVVYQTTMLMNGSASTINFGQNVTLTAVVTSRGKNPAMTGQVQFNGGGLTFTNVTNTPGTDSSGNQTLTVTATTVPQGTVFFSASYPGDTNFEYANSNGLLVNVNIPDFTLGPQNGLSVVPVAGQPGSAPFTITPVSQMPSTVMLQVNTPSIIAGYMIGISTTQVNLNGAAATAMLTLTPIGSTPAALRAQIRKAGIISAGQGEWWRLGLAIGLAVIFLAGFPERRRRRRFVFGLSAVGLLYFALGCGGGGGGGGGGGITATPTSVAIATSDAKVPSNGNYMITATVTGSSNLTGTISFYDYGNLVTSVPVTNGKAGIGINDVGTIGVHQITARYSGDANNLASTSTGVSQTITGTLQIAIEGATGVDTHSIIATAGIQ
jgi:hypothetical protein